MTTQEADILRYMELRCRRLDSLSGTVSDRAIRQQFGMGLDVALSSLLRHLCIERDGHYYRVTSVGETALAEFTSPDRRVPFAGRSAW